MPNEPYIVLARKHRPKQLADVIGQGHVARTLSNAINQNRVAHALLFTGPRGIGKTSTARIMARALNCQQGPTATPCGECPSCIEIAEGSSVDVIEIDAASNRGIDEIRDLREAVRYPPSRERYKVYIIDEVHMLTTPAFNALLKTLEEPPPRVIFIFATTEPHKIPDTILSRCQRYDFRRIPYGVIQSYLAQLAEIEGIEAEPEALRLVAQQSEGCMRDALSVLDQLVSFSDGPIKAELASRVLGAVGRDALFRLSAALLGRDPDKVLEIVDNAYQIGVNLVRLASDLLEHLRDLTVCAVSRGKGALLHLTDEEQERLTEQVRDADSAVLHRMFSILLETTNEMSRSAYPRLVLEMALIRMTAIEPVQPIGSLIERIESLASGQLPTPSGTPQSGGSSAGPTSGRGGATSSGGSPVSRAASAAPPAAVATPPLVKTAPPAQATTRTASSPQDHPQRWRALVEAVQKRGPAVSGLLKEARLEPGSGDVFKARLSRVHFDLINDEQRLALVTSVATELYGQSARVELDVYQPGETNGDDFSVGAAEDAERENERKRRVGQIENHPVTKAIRDVFEVAPEQVRITPQPLDGDHTLETES